ncbi:MAG: hypothetical protein JJU45_12445 [Acidimicrobiia bacterium]|nr:hypothetical protein [Acidimicrobiia bacterium]
MALVVVAALLSALSCGSDDGGGEDEEGSGTTAPVPGQAAEPTETEAPYVEGLEDWYSVQGEVTEAEARCGAVGLVRVLDADRLAARNADPRSIGGFDPDVHFAEDALEEQMRGAQQVWLGCIDAIEFLVRSVEAGDGSPEDVACVRQEAEGLADAVAAVLASDLAPRGMSDAEFAEEFDRLWGLARACPGAVEAMASQAQEVYSEVPGAIEPN